MAPLMSRYSPIIRPAVPSQRWFLVVNIRRLLCIASEVRLGLVVDYCVRVTASLPDIRDEEDGSLKGVNSSTPSAYEQFFVPTFCLQELNLPYSLAPLALCGGGDLVVLLVPNCATFERAPHRYS